MRVLAVAGAVSAAIALVAVSSATALGPQGAASPTGMRAAPGGFTYQGRLTGPGGQAVEGQANLSFELWDDPVAGNQVGSTVTRNNVPVTGGLFTTTVDVSPGQLVGEPLWLRVGVNGQWLEPRQALSPTPYAFGLVPGARAEAGMEDPVTTFRNTDIGVAVAAESISGTAVIAISDVGVGLSASAGEVPAVYLAGLYGVLAAGEDNGVKAWGGKAGGAFSGTKGIEAFGDSRGVEGTTDGSQEGDAGVFGESTNRNADGVRGEGAHGIHGIGYTGVFGEGDVGIAGEGVGVGVVGQSTSGDGVAGRSDAKAGVRGTSGNGYGVHGSSDFDHGVFGQSSGGFAAGVAGVGVTGVFGTGAMLGVSGWVTSTSSTGVLGSAEGTQSVGVEGIADALGGTGLKGHATFGVGVVAEGETGVKGKGLTGAGVEGEGATGVAGRSVIGGPGVSGTGGTGVLGESATLSGEGVRGIGTGSLTEGVLGGSTNGIGVYGMTSGASAAGVRGDSTGTWGIYTPDNLRVDGTCSGCDIVLLAENAGTQQIEVGDVVAVTGIAPALTGGRRPLLTVRHATPEDHSLLAVVVEAATVDTVPARGPNGKATGAMEEMPRFSPGPIASGDRLYVLLRGMARVRVDASAGPIAVGDPLSPSAASPGRLAVHAADAGLASRAGSDSEPGPVVGRALEGLAAGDGLVWALVVGR